MMVVREDSWHYRLWNTGYGLQAKIAGEPKPRMPRSLCPYFWSFVYIPFSLYGAIILRLLKVLMVKPMRWLIGFGSTVAAVVGASIVASGLTAWGLLAPFSLAMSALAVVIFVVALAVVCVVLVFISDRRRKIGPDGMPVPREPSLLVSFVKAKKQRVCPLIEYRP